MRLEMSAKTVLCLLDVYVGLLTCASEQLLIALGTVSSALYVNILKYVKLQYPYI